MPSTFVRERETVDRDDVEPSSQLESRHTPSGGAAAAIVAAGFGCALLGILTLLSESIVWVDERLTFNSAVGALSGKTTVAVVLWVAGWALLHARWSDREVNLSRSVVAMLALLGVGFVLTFPTVFLIFAAE